ncbi:alpha-L-fucosidase [Hymenobacter sp.]|uniref:alpha-L-fucosidase n=1 Tax=Hymenobacter sp. TaxID=1898978 RepID=UPI00286B4025|nr:alpha-L-fucosidase [Hymenobacter sp.]
MTPAFRLRRGALILVVLLFFRASYGFAQQPLAAETRLGWWQDAKFGMFLHWGLYSVAGGDWKGKRYKGNEHFMLYERIPLKEYATLAAGLNPVRYDAEQWVRAAKDAGMKYIVITAKHHEGFAMFNSPSNDYNIVKRTPYGQDPMVPLAAACRKHGLKLCFYYSLGRDWEDPDVPTNWPVKAGRSNSWDYPNEDAKDLARYIERKVKPQLRELLTQYGPVGVIWFDTPELITAAQSRELREFVLSLQPNCLINSRVGNGLGDFEVSEQKLVAEVAAKPWESSITMSKGWGYNRHDTAYKSPELLVRNLVQVVSKGGNFLLNIGPTSAGELPAPSLQNLAAVGRWMRRNQEAIYGTSPLASADQPEAVAESAPPAAANTMKDALNDVTSKAITPDFRYTTKNGKTYLFARSWPPPLITVPAYAGRPIRRVRLLGDAKKLKWKLENGNLLLPIPADFAGEIPVYVFELEHQRAGR